MSPPSSALVQIRTLWSAFAIGCLMYVVVARWLSPAAAPRSAILPDPGEPLELGLALAALGTVAIGFVVPRLLARLQRARLGSAPASEEALLRAALLPLTVRYGLFETAGVIGLILVVMDRPAAKVLPFVGLALAALVLNFPTRERAMRVLQD